MVQDEKENTDWKVYLTTLVILGGVVIILVVKFFVTDFFNEDNRVNLSKMILNEYYSWFRESTFSVTQLLYPQINCSTFTPLEQQINSNFK